MKQPVNVLVMYQENLYRALKI